MDVLLKRHFWIVHLLVIAVGAWFAAKAVGEVVAAKVLKDNTKPIVGQKAPPLSDTTRDKVGTAIAERNMFCSSCNPPPPSEAVASNPGGGPIPTGLPLRLIATNVAAKDSFSFATLQNTSDQKQGAYWVGDEIPGAGRVTSIAARFVDFENSTTRQVERVSLAMGDAPMMSSIDTPPISPPPGALGPPPDELSSLADASVKKLNDTTFEVDRALIDKALGNQAALMKQGRVTPAMKNGQPDGFRLMAIKPNSVFAKLGVQSGDILHSINGLNLNSMEGAMKAVMTLKEARNLSLAITRRGKDTTLNYTIK